jgi:hypothetical protein
MQLANRLAHANGVGVELNFFGQIAQIRFSLFVVFGDDFVTGAVIAKRFTKGNVNVNRQGSDFWLKPWLRNSSA